MKYQLRVDAGLIENTWIMQTICKVQYCEKVLGTLRCLYVFVNHMMPSCFLKNDDDLKCIFSGKRESCNACIGPCRSSVVTSSSEPVNA